MRIDCDDLLKRLHQIGAATEMMSIGSDWTLVVSALGGRIHGPYLNGRDQIGWAAPEFATEDSLRELSDSRNWNIGAQRLWMSPELRIFVGDRDQFWDTFIVPEDLDPGQHVLQRDGDAVLITQSGRLKDSGQFGVRRRVLPSQTLDPIARFSPVAACGFRHDITIASEDAALPVLPWVVAQVEPGGEAIVPVDDGLEVTTMLGDPPAPVLDARSGVVRMPINCSRLYKIGTLAAGSFGELGYRLDLGHESIFQLYKCSHDRSGSYPDEPAAAPGETGCSTFVFQDNGLLGSYGELEFVGQDDGFEPNGWRRSKLTVDVLTCIGTQADIENVEQNWLSGLVHRDR